MFFTYSAVRVKPGVPPWCSALTKKYNLNKKLSLCHTNSDFIIPLKQSSEERGSFIRRTVPICLILSVFVLYMQLDIAK